MVVCYSWLYREMGHLIYQKVKIKIIRVVYGKNAVDLVFREKEQVKNLSLCEA